MTKTAEKIFELFKPGLMMSRGGTRYNTSFGHKTYIGVLASIENIIKEGGISGTKT